MSSRKSLTILSIKLPKNITQKSVLNILEEYPYSNNATFGFSDSMSEGVYIESILMQRSSVAVKSVDSMGNREDKSIYVYSFTRFLIDFKFELIEIYGAAKDVGKVIRRLGKALGKDVAISLCKTFPCSFIPKLQEKIKTIDIQKLDIENFKYNEYAVGRFLVNIDSPKTALELLDKYSKDVGKAYMSLILNNNSECDLEMNSAGRFSIKANNETENSMIDLLKELLNDMKNG